MTIKLGSRELKALIMEMVRDELSPSEVIAGLLWHYCINSQDHFYKGEYYDLPVSFQYDNDGVSLIKATYLHQNNQWTVLFPDYKHLMHIVPLILKWLDDTYSAYVASQQRLRTLKSGKKRRRGPQISRPRPRENNQLTRSQLAALASSLLDSLPKTRTKMQKDSDNYSSNGKSMQITKK